MRCKALLNVCVIDMKREQYKYGIIIIIIIIIVVVVVVIIIVIIVIIILCGNLLKQLIKVYFLFRYDWRCNFDYYHQNGICNDTIDQYYTNFSSMIWGVYPNNNYSCHHGAGNAVMGMNEPNHFKQSNRTGEQVAAIWHLVEQNANGKPIISPSAAPCGKDCNGNTTEWFDSFFAACNGSCNITYLATHTYWCNADKVMNFLLDLYNRYGYKIWLTEFTCRPNPKKVDKAGRVRTFLEAILPRLESADYVDRYYIYFIYYL